MNIVTILLIVFGMLSQGAFIFAEYKKKWSLAVVLKGTASVFFVCLGI